MDIFEYINDNFALDGTAQRLVNNIIDFVVVHCTNAVDASSMFVHLLDGIGVTDEECKRFGEWLFEEQR